MKTDLEKFKFVASCLDLYLETYIKENEVELAVYYWNNYLGSIYFNFDGSLIGY